MAVTFAGADTRPIGTMTCDRGCGAVFHGCPAMPVSRPGTAPARARTGGRPYRRAIRLSRG
ncbi:hypothetical protein ABZ761_40390 [Kitasatospora sp. NPDC006786]|uniref:hypothetical protein n=1 Tax=Kitasatospora sp. NPDC006786 TaxID=3157187 RepID=UPI0033D21F14